MFRITDGKGFHVTFPNGYTVSVQFGPRNICTNQKCGLDNVECGERGSATVETAVWAADGKRITMEGDTDSVRGWQTPLQVLKLLNWAAEQDYPMPE